MQNTFSNVCFVWIVNPILISIVPNQPCEKVTDLMNVNICTRSEILFIMHRIAISPDILPILQWSVEFSWPPNRVGLAVPVMQPPWPKLQALLATGNHTSFNSTSFSEGFHHFCTKSSQPPRHCLVMSLRFKSGLPFFYDCAAPCCRNSISWPYKPPHEGTGINPSCVEQQEFRPELIQQNVWKFPSESTSKKKAALYADQKNK